MYLLNDNSDRYRYAFFFILIATTYALFDAYMMYSAIVHTDALIANPSIDKNSLQSFETNFQMHIIVYTTFFLLTAIVFIHWYRRAYYNVHEFSDRKPKHEEWWAAAAWFVPLLCYFYPVQVMEDIWDKSLRYLNKRGELKKISKPPIFIYLWWIPFALSLLVANIAYILDGHSESLSDFRIGLQLDIVASCLLFIAGVFLLLVMRAYHKVERAIFQNNINTQFEAEDIEANS